MTFELAHILSFLQKEADTGRVEGNVAVTGVLMMYSSLNLRPDLPASASAHSQTYHRITLYLTFLLPTSATSFYVWPISRWLRRTGTSGTPWKSRAVPTALARREANAPT